MLACEKIRSLLHILNFEASKSSALVHTNRKSQLL